MKKILLAVVAMGLFLFQTTGLALAVDDATVEAIENKASLANAKAEGNNSRIQGLEAAVADLQSRIVDQDIAQVISELCSLYRLTEKNPPLLCFDCGDGYLQPLEDCEDGNLINGDGCNDVCQSEVCGDGKIDEGEECDDGNVEDGDSCSPTCYTLAKRVFVTSETYSGNLGGLSGADAKCNDLAAAAGLNGTYKAWLSDININASDRLSHFYSYYTLVDGTPVAYDWDDLTDGNLINPINKNENGTIGSGSLTWTNTQINGERLINSQYNTTCNSWLSSTYTYQGTGGHVGYSDYYWTESPYGASFCAVPRSLYCFEQ